MNPRRFKLRFWLGLAIAAIVLVVPATAQAENVVPNPGFEVGPCPHSDWEPGSIICDWSLFFGSGLIWQSEISHSGAASLGLWCEDGENGCSAATDHARCAAIGPGSHAASFWYRVERPSGVEFLALGASFFKSPNCIGGARTDFFDGYDGPNWRQTTGVLDAPPGTQSAYFHVHAGLSWCGGPCTLEVKFDDLYVDSGTPPGPALDPSSSPTSTTEVLSVGPPSPPIQP